VIKGDKNMSVNSINNTQAAGVYSYEADANSKKAQEKEQAATASQSGVVYEKSQDAKKATYSVNKMSSSERAALVQQLKADQQSRQESMVKLVQKMMKGQAKSYSMASGDDSIWKFLASGNFTVDAATKAQAQQDISEDGYWGVKQTSQRLFDFASALAGDDVEKMKKMQAAMEKGFKLATKSWGKDLPGISKDTMTAANKLFDEYYQSKGVEE